MKRLSRALALTILVAAFFSISAAAVATEGTEETGTTLTETTVPPVDFEPAVPVTTPDTIEPLSDWTYRYMVPTGIAIALLVAIITSVQYFTRVVRKRYRIVQE
ncbi:MAG: hypothetical protein M3P87_11440 [Actinomycetota bacterium]|nr:hypothetical protein [Actinomycetota bacterium]